MNEGKPDVIISRGLNRETGLVEDILVKTRECKLLVKCYHIFMG